MICAIGIGLLGFMALRRAHRRWHGYSGCGPGGCGPGGCGHGGWGPGGYGCGHGGHGPWGGGHRHGRRRWMLHAMLARIDATPAQERAIVGELDRLVERVRGARAGLKDARGDLAAALRGASLDDAALGGVLGRVDATTGEVRTAALEALRNVHAVLDEKQRAQLAELIDRGGGWWRGGGPYR